jgi:hypothetical protein
MSSDSVLIASLRSLRNTHGMAALEEAITTLRSEHPFSCSFIRNNAEQWVHTLMSLRSERKKEDWRSCSGWLAELGHQARKEGLAPYLPPVSSRENPDALQSGDQQSWTTFVRGIQSMFEISTFREGATVAKDFWATTPLATPPHRLFAALAREQKKTPPPPAKDLPLLSPSKRSQKQIEWSNFVARVQKKMNIASFRDACHAAKEIIATYQKNKNVTNYRDARQAVYSIYSIA